jgi:plastocyanin
MEITGVSYYLLRDQAGNDHPQGFTGGFDNWHLHYNLCRGAGSDAILTPEDCAAVGGTYSNAAAWMIHAWANPDRDNDLGVFSMWNPSIWPASDPEAVVEARAGSVFPDPDGVSHSISDFRFATLVVGVGEEIRFANAASVPHTFTAGSPGSELGAFDSGVLAPGQSFSLTIDERGVFSYFCALHPDMQGTIIVE